MVICFVRCLCGDGSRDTCTDVGAVDRSSRSEKDDAVRLMEGMERDEDSIERGEPGMLLSVRDSKSPVHIGSGRDFGRTCRETVRSREELH